MWHKILRRTLQALYLAGGSMGESVTKPIVSLFLVGGKEAVEIEDILGGRFCPEISGDSKRDGPNPPDSCRALPNRDI